MLGRTSNAQWENIDPTLKNSIATVLQPGEDILFCCQTQWNMIWIMAVTARQVIICKAILVKDHLFSKARVDMPIAKALPLDQIARIEQGQNPDYDLFVVRMFGPSEQALDACFVSSDSAQPFLDALNKAQTAGSLQPATQQPQNPAQRLRQLEHLLQEGLISEAEYAQKRAQILQSL